MEHVFPLLYFGPKAYYSMLAHEDAPFLALADRYSKQTLRSRIQIYGANGKTTLSIPIKRVHGKETELRNALISYEEPWRQVHWRSIKSAYSRTPYFEFFEDKFEALYRSEPIHLSDFLIHCNTLIFDILKIKIPLGYLDEIDVDLQKRLDFLSLPNAYTKDEPYYQIFADRHGFIPNLSVLDWIFHCGNKI